MSLKVAKRIFWSCRRHWRQKLFNWNCRWRQRSLQASVRIFRNPLLVRNVQFLLEKLQSRDQCWQPLVFARVIKLTQTFVCFALAAFAIRKLVGREPFFITPRAGQYGRLRIKFESARVIFVFFLVKPRQRIIKLRFLRIIFYPALEKILTQSEIFPLRLDAQGQAWLGLIVHGCHARVPGHVPCSHVPKQNRARLQRCYLAEQQKDATPFRSLPRDVRLDVKSIGNDRAKSTERGDETELSDLFS